MDRSDIAAEIARITPALAALRHEIHAHPELAFEEIETAKRILDRLTPLKNLRIQTGLAKTGIVATLNADKPGRCVALRAEMDALPIEEKTGAAYASNISGKMHACGHDGHSTCLVGAAIVLSQMADKLPGKVKFIFQPAEESGGGGGILCEQGVLGDPDVDAAFALHGWPYMDLGEVGICPGPAMAATNPWKIVIRGKGAHAAYPHRGVDPIVVAAHVVTALQTIASRNIDPLDAVVVTVATINAGTAGNIIPESAELTGTIRTLDADVRQRVVERFCGLVEQTAAAFGATARVDLRWGYPVVVNDGKMSALVADVAREIVGPEKVQENLRPSMGGEDFAYYAERVPAAFWRLGVRRGDPAVQPTLHQPTYDFPDEAIPLAVRMHCEIAMRFLHAS
ncbi:MAG TPA: M20 family metallopeptidase [Phycisphaerae bacterium]|nr:M20 family metallopeptidase [Phycisphaerae bacterium]